MPEITLEQALELVDYVLCKDGDWRVLHVRGDVVRRHVGVAAMSAAMSADMSAAMSAAVSTAPLAGAHGSWSKHRLKSSSGLLKPMRPRISC
jgi:hypothetical protein